MASTPLYRWLLLALLATLVISAAIVPGSVADDDGDEDEDLEGGSGSGGYEAGEGEGTEVVSSGEDVEETEEEMMLQPAPGVHTSLIFPASVGKMPVVRAGQQADILFGISNEGGSPLKINGLLAKLYVTYDYRVVAQNFTGEFPSNVTMINATVPRGSLSSFAFHFTPFHLLQPMQFGLAATVFYEVDGTPHASVLYNSTIELIEPAGMVSGETVFLVLLGAGLLALVGMWASAQLESLSKRAKRSKKVETGTGDDADSTNEWLQGTFFNTKTGKTGASKPKSKRR